MEERILNIRYKKAMDEGTEEAYDEFLANNRYNKYTDEIEELRKALNSEEEEADAEEEFTDSEPAVTKPAPKRKVVKKAKKRYNPSPAAKPKTPTPQKKKSTTVSDFKRLIGG